MPEDPAHCKLIYNVLMFWDQFEPTGSELPHAPDQVKTYHHKKGFQ